MRRGNWVRMMRGLEELLHFLLTFSLFLLFRRFFLKAQETMGAVSLAAIGMRDEWRLQQMAGQMGEATFCWAATRTRRSTRAIVPKAFLGFFVVYQYTFSPCAIPSRDAR